MRQTLRLATPALALLLTAVLGAGLTGCGRDAGEETAAPGADGVRFESAELGRAVGGDGSITDPTSDFGPNDTIYVSVETSGFADSTTLAARWTYEDGQEVDRTETTIAHSGTERTELHVSSPGGWPPGDYQVEILLDGRSVETLDFEVSG